MTTRQLNGIVERLQRAALQHDAGITDAQLLERFITVRDAVAFISHRLPQTRHDGPDTGQGTSAVADGPDAKVQQGDIVSKRLPLK